jgi:hypothetical protein
MSPRQRWMKDAQRAIYIDEEKLRIAFLWRELRTPDKAGVLKLFGQAYQVLPQLARKRVEVRYDPENLDVIEIFYNHKFRQLAKPLNIQPNRAPKQITPPAEPSLPKTDYLGWLTKQHRHETDIPAPVKTTHDPAVAILRAKLAPEVWDEAAAADFFDTIAPVDPEKLTRIIDDLLCVHPPNLHLSFYLEHIGGVI